jgi:hypothetical protein
MAAITPEVSDLSCPAAEVATRKGNRNPVNRFKSFHERSCVWAQPSSIAVAPRIVAKDRSCLPDRSCCSPSSLECSSAPSPITGYRQNAIVDGGGHSFRVVRTLNVQP